MPDRPDIRVGPDLDHFGPWIPVPPSEMVARVPQWGCLLVAKVTGSTRDRLRDDLDLMWVGRDNWESQFLPLAYPKGE